MKRGDFYRVRRGLQYDPKKQRVYLIVSRQGIIDNAFSSVICAPVYSSKMEEVNAALRIALAVG